MGMIESKDRATSDPGARKDVMKQMEKEGVQYVLFWFTDIEGHLKSFAITPSEIEGALNDGMGFDGSSITGFNAIEESDMVAIPDPTTYRLMPTREGEAKVGRMICDVVKPDGSPYEGALDKNGFARVDKIKAGTCKLSFPRIDRSEWKPA